MRSVTDPLGEGVILLDGLGDAITLKTVPGRDSSLAVLGDPFGAHAIIPW